MKKFICFLLIGVMMFGLVSVVLAEEVDNPEEAPVSDLSSEEPVGSNPEDSPVAVPADPGDTGDLDDPGIDLPDDGSSAADPDTELIVEDGGEGILDELDEGEFIQDTGDVHINADAVYLTAEEEPILYSVGDVLSGGAFFDVDTSELGTVKIYIPIDYQEGSFAYDNYGNLVNIRASTITGYVLDGTQYSVRWTSFGTPQYRLLNYSGVGSSYNDLNIESVQDTNIQIIEDDTEVPLFPDARFVQLLILLCLGVLVLCQFMKA